MKVKATWKNKNPFADLEHLSRSSVAEVPDETPIEKLKQYAIEATPEGYFLKSIVCEKPDAIYHYE